MEGKSDVFSYGFSLITLKPSTIEIKCERHRGPLVKTQTDIHVALERSRSKFDLRSRSRRDPSCISVEAYGRDKNIETTFMSSDSSQSQVIGKNCWWPRVTSDDFSGVTDQHLTLGHHEWPKSTWSWKNCALLMRWEGFQYFPHWFPNWLITERSGAWPDPRS